MRALVLLLPALLLPMLAGCEDAARYGSPTVARAPHPPWSRPAAAPAQASDEDFRAQPPARPELSPPPLPEVHSTLASGVRLITLERRALPIVAIRIVMSRGAADAAPGVASLAAATLYDGTTTSNRQAVQETLAEMGAIFSATAGPDAITLDAKVPAENVLPALQVLAHVLRAPAFPDEWLETERVRIVAALERESVTPAQVASARLDAALYAPGARYHTQPQGDLESLARVAPSEVAAFWRAAAVPAQTTFIVAGDFDRAAVQARLERLFASWTGSPVAPAAVVAPPAPRGAVLLVDHPGDSQALLRVGWLVCDRDSPDVETLRVLASVLAHDNTGRLDWTLRGERGDTYGVNAGVVPRPGASEFVIGTAVQTDKAADAVGIITAEIEGRRQHPLEPGEIPGALHMASALTWQSFATTSRAVNALTPAAVYHEPLERFLARMTTPRQMGPDELQRAAQKYLAAEGRVIVVVGDAARIRPGLEALGFRVGVGGGRN